MQHLDLYDVLAIAARVWQVDAQTAIRRTDLEVVEVGLAKARSADELAEALAAMLQVFVRERPFEGSNRVVSMAVLLQFAGKNGCDLDLEPVGQLDDLLDCVKESRVALAEVTGLLSSRLRHLQHPISPEEGNMFEKFSERARRVMVLAQEEARGLDHDYIGTEHLLIAIIHEGDGVAAKVLAHLNISETAARATVLEIVGRGRRAPAGHIPFTPRSKRVLEYSLREALQLGNNYIGTEHILLGIIQDGEGVAAQTLVKLGADLPRLRQLVCNRQRSEAAVSDFLTGDGEPFLTMPTRKHHLLGELENLIDENDRLYELVRELRDKLRQHNIDPDA
jgi:ClpA/ClpB-like protein